MYKGEGFLCVKCGCFGHTMDICTYQTPTTTSIPPPKDDIPRVNEVKFSHDEWQTLKFPQKNALTEQQKLYLLHQCPQALQLHRLHNNKLGSHQGNNFTNFTTTTYGSYQGNN